jgi:hypothetical protein
MPLFLHTHRRQIIQNRNVILDFGRFNGCTFIGCKLLYFGLGPLQLSDCTLDSSPVHPRGPAARTVAFMRELKRDMPIMDIYAGLADGALPDAGPAALGALRPFFAKRS